MGRRTGVLVGALALLAMTACGSDDDGNETSAAGNGTDEAAADEGWSYVDGSGQETTLDAVPERIVMHGSSAAALIPLGIRPVGIYADQAVEEDLALRNLDLDGIEIVGEEWGIVNVEAVAALPT